MPSTPKPVDCSELAATITKIALNIGADPKFNTIDKITTEMQRTIPELSEQQVIDSIAEAALVPNDFISTVSKEEIPQNKALERLVFERNQIRKKINARIRSLKPVGVWGRVAEPLNAARAIMTSFDFSAALRQGGFIVIAHPIRSVRSLDALFKSLSKQGQAKIEAEIQSRPNAPLYARYKLFIAEIGSSAGLTKQEEVYMSRWAERIPIVAASQRSYTTFLNKLRADAFDASMATLAKNGEVTAEEGFALANFINIATGRGNIPGTENAAVVMNTIFFAPRYVASRFHLLLSQPLSIVTPQKLGGQPSLRLRKLIAAEYARYLIGMGVIYALSRAAGWEVEEDPRSSDFGKIKIGRTRMDPLSGISQVAVFLGRVSTGKTKSTKTGRISSIREDVTFGRRDAAGVIGTIVRSKLAPVPGSVIDVLSGKDITGNKVTLRGEIGELITPLALRDIIDIMQEEESVPVKTAEGLAVIFGVGAQVHKPRRK